MRKKHDLYISLGRGCYATQVLRALNLQFWSFPFDWVAGSNLNDRIKFLKEDFKGYLDQSEFIYTHSDNAHDCYRNKKTDILFPHEFPVNIPLERSFKNFELKYKRRINRLNRLIKKSKYVCFLYIWTPGDERFYTDDELILAVETIQSKFKNIVADFIYFEIDNIPYEQKKVIQINKKIKKIIFDYSAHDEKRPWEVKRLYLEKCLKDYSISLKHLTFMNILQKYKIYKFKDNRYKKIKSTLFLLKNQNIFV